MLTGTRALAGTLLTAALLNAAVVTIDEQVVYQTIRGMGGHQPRGQSATLVDDLGMSAHRAEIMPDGSSLPSWNEMKDLADRGVRCFIACPWSPPAGFKSNNSVTNGGELLVAHYQNYAVFLANWIKKFRLEVGVDLYAISPQNEPRFAQSFRSCVYTPQTLRDFTAVLGAELREQGLNTRILLADDMLGSFSVTPMAQMGATDAVAGQYVSGIAVHGYSNGVNPTPSSQTALMWGGGRGVSDFAIPRGLTTWMTETSGYWNNWTDGMDLASTMYIALKHGLISGWFWWRLAVTESYWEDEALILNGTKLINYHVHKHYYRWIRPDALHIDAASSDTLVHAVAFRHEGNSSLTIILLNWGTSAKSVSLAAAGANALPAQYRMHLSDATKRCSDEGTVSGASLNLPAKSIATLYATGYAPSVGVNERPPRAEAAATADMRPGNRMRVFALDGTFLGELPPGARVSDAYAAGSYWVVSIDRGGRGSVARRLSIPF